MNKCSRPKPGTMDHEELHYALNKLFQEEENPSVLTARIELGSLNSSSPLAYLTHMVIPFSSPFVPIKLFSWNNSTIFVGMVGLSRSSYQSVLGIQGLISHPISYGYILVRSPSTSMETNPGGSFKWYL